MRIEFSRNPQTKPCMVIGLRIVRGNGQQAAFGCCGADLSAGRYVRHAHNDNTTHSCHLTGTLPPIKLHYAAYFFSNPSLDSHCFNASNLLVAGTSLLLCSLHATTAHSRPRHAFVRAPQTNPLTRRNH